MDEVERKWMEMLKPKFEVESHLVFFGLARQSSIIIIRRPQALFPMLQKRLSHARARPLSELHNLVAIEVGM